MRFLQLSVVLLAATTAPAVALAHFDVVPYEQSGKLATGGYDDGTGALVIATRVFGFDFGEVVSNPYVIGDPGFNNGSGFAAGVFPNDGALPAGFTLGFDVLTNLKYWDGSGPVSFTDCAGRRLFGT